MKKLLLPLLTLAGAVALLAFWSNGFRTFTVFSDTLHRAGPLPREFPDIPLRDQDGKAFHLKDQKKFHLVNFVYLNCPEVCHKINNRLEGVYHGMEGGLIPKVLEFVTISFDQKNDSLERIRSYRSQFEPGIAGWTFALTDRVSSKDFEGFLRQAGVWAKPVPKTGLINHSIYQFLVSPENRIVAVFDPGRETDAAILARIRSCLDG